MSFGANTDKVPGLPCYAAAAKWEADVKPIRGRTPECKPLGDRKKTSVTIRREGDDIIAKLYYTDLVRWKPDGTIIVRQDGHETQTTRKYLNALLQPVFSSWQGVTYAWRGMDDDDPNTGTGVGHPLHAYADNIFMGDPNNVRPLHFVNPKPCVVHVKNRAGSKAVREQYAGFIKYVKNIKKLMGDTPIKPEADRYITPAALLEMAAGDNLDEHHYILMYLSQESGRYKYVQRPKPLDVLAKFETMLLYGHRDEMLTTVELPRGKLGVDRYKNFF